MSDDSGDGCAGWMIFAILIIVAVMCSRQAEHLGYTEGLIPRPETDTLIFEDVTH